MEMILTKGDDQFIVKKIKDDKNWLTIERLTYIVEQRPQVFQHLHPLEIPTKEFLQLLNEEKNLDLLVHVLSKNATWKIFINQSIKRPLTIDNFIKVLDMLEESEYEPLAKQFLKKIDKNTVIPWQLVKYMEEEQAFKFLTVSNNMIAFNQLNENAKSIRVCREYFINKANQHELSELYQTLPIEAKNDFDIAMKLCQINKQNYKILSPQAKIHESIVHFVISRIIPSTSDSSCDEIDENAIKIKDLPLESVRNINSLYLIKSILKNNPKLCQDEKIKEKWFSNPDNKKELIQFIDYFPASNDLIKDFKSYSVYEKSCLMMQNKKLIPLFMKEMNPDDYFELCYHYQNSKSFNQVFNDLSLKNFLCDKLDGFIKYYMKKLDNKMNYHQAEVNSLHFSIWLFKQKEASYSQAACQLMSKVVKNNPDILDKDLRYLYHIECNTLRKNSNLIYEYMDQNTTQDIKKFHKKF